MSAGKRGLAIALILTLGAGCATTQIDRANQAALVGLHVFTTGADALEAAKEAEEQSLIEQVQAGKLSPDAAEAQYEAWMRKAVIAQKLLVELFHAVASVADTVAAIDAKQQGDLAGAMAKVVALVAEATQALADVGVKLPLPGAK